MVILFVWLVSVRSYVLELLQCYSITGYPTQVIIVQFSCNVIIAILSLLLLLL